MITDIFLRFVAFLAGIFPVLFFFCIFRRIGLSMHADQRDFIKCPIRSARRNIRRDQISVISSICPLIVRSPSELRLIRKISPSSKFVALTRSVPRVRERETKTRIKTRPARSVASSRLASEDVIPARVRVGGISARGSATLSFPFSLSLVLSGVYALRNGCNGEC